MDSASLQYYLNQIGTAGGPAGPQWCPLQAWLEMRQEEKRINDRSMCLDAQGLCFTFVRGQMTLVTKGPEVVWRAPQDGA